MTDNAADEEVVPYDSTPFPGWAEKVASWGWTKIYQDQKIVYYGIEGTCPRCRHQMSTIRTNTPIESFLVEAEKFRESLWTDTPPESEYVQCNCSIAHPTHAAGEGCGQYGYVPFAKAIQKSQS